jgi:hypothetical protein
MPRPGLSSAHMQAAGALVAMLMLVLALVAGCGSHDVSQAAPEPDGRTASPTTSGGATSEPDAQRGAAGRSGSPGAPGGGSGQAGNAGGGSSGGGGSAAGLEQPPHAAPRPPDPPDRVSAPEAEDPGEGETAAPAEEPPSRPVAPGPAGPPAREIAPAPNRADVDRFLNDCNNKVAAWKHDARISWPGSLDIEVDKSTVFIASIDLTGATVDLPSGTPKDSTLSVQCQATATLKAPEGGELKVGTNDGSSNTRSFAPTGKVQWAWSVTAVKPGTHELQLVIQPALVIGSHSVDSDPSMQQVVYVSRVNVTASPLAIVSLWIKDSWPLVLSICTVMGAATVGAVKWYGNVKDEVTRASRRRNPRGRGTDRDRAAADVDQDERAAGYL